MAFKKIINDPYKVVDEMVEGIVLAHHDILKFANNNKRAVVRKDSPVKDKVGKYGRILGKFKAWDAQTDAWVNLNQLMIIKHHAVEYHGQSKEDIAEQHIKNRLLVELS